MDIGKGIKGIIFDLDGTLFHLNVNWEELKNEITSSIGRPFDSFEELFKRAHNPSSKATKLLEEAEVAGVKSGEASEFAREVLQSIDLPISIVTRNSHKAAEAALERLGRLDAQVIGREDVEQLKPHPEALILAARNLGLELTNIVMVGDTLHDVEAARAANIKCIIVKNDKIKFMPQGADYYINNLKELETLIAKINKE